MKYLFTLLIISTFLYSKTYKATYEAKYSFFGTIIKANGIYENNKTNYHIKTILKTTGIAASLSNNLIQSYESIGIIKKNILIPKKFIFFRKNYHKKVVITYLFDYKNRVIKKIKYQNSKFIYDKNLTYFTKNDILTIYFNLPQYINKNKNNYTFYAVEGKKNSGRIDVNIIKDNQNIIIIKANLYNKIFLDNKGIVYLTIDKKYWITQKAIMKNILHLGDVKGELKKEEIIP